MPDEFVCPRRSEDAGMASPGMEQWRAENPFDHWHRGNKPALGEPWYHYCSYCGSLRPDVVLEGIERELFELGPTDKNYKVYISMIPNEAEAVKMVREGRTGRHVGKFYFQHFDDEQRKRFIELWNQHRIVIGYPGFFYAMPFFVQPADPPPATTAT